LHDVAFDQRCIDAVHRLPSLRSLPPTSVFINGIGLIHAFAWVLMLSSAALFLVTLLSAADPHALRFLHLHRIINPGNGKQKPNPSLISFSFS
jgi:hypothetical protein